MVIDTYADLINFNRVFSTIFISHQWLGYDAPDPVRTRAYMYTLARLCRRALVRVHA